MIERILTRPAATLAVLFLLALLLVAMLVTIGASFDEVAKGKGVVQVDDTLKGKG